MDFLDFIRKTHEQKQKDYLEKKKGDLIEILPTKGTFIGNVPGTWRRAKGPKTRRIKGKKKEKGRWVTIMGRHFFIPFMRGKKSKKGK